MIKRKLLNELRAHLKDDEITVITGPRQVGKTTLMRILMEELIKDGQPVLFFNLDFEADSIYFQSQQHLVNKIKLEFGQKRGYVFIDEIQRKENAGIFLKGIYDRKFPYKFIVSGSGSLELKEKIQESLSGRKRLFELYPVSFEEFIHYRTNYKYEDNFADFIQIESKKIDFYLIEYLNFGGYPGVITKEREQDKRILMEEIFHSYVERDLVYWLRIDRPEIFTKLIRLMSVQAGQLVNYSKLSAGLGISVQTLKKYLWFAQKTFVIDLVTPFFKNFKKEITKSPSVYFVDLGLRNYAVGQMGRYQEKGDMGFLFQNFIYNLLKEKVKPFGWNLHFYRTTDKAEVDLIIDRFTTQIPVEIKFIDIRKDSIKRSMRSFIEKYSPAQAWIINSSYESEMIIGKTMVLFIPYFRLMQDDFMDKEMLNVEF